MRGYGVVAGAVIAAVLLGLVIVPEARSQDWSTLAPDGYVIFEYSTLQTLSALHVPTADDVAKKISCTLARDEYESVQLGVHALVEDIRDIEVKVESDLKVTIYHRIKPALKEELRLMNVNSAGEGGIASWVQSAVHLQRGSVFPQLSKGKSVNFWLTFRADDDTREGLYRGQVRIKPAGRPETVLALEVNVRPFKLDRPRAAFGIWMREDMLPKHIGGLAAPSETVLAIYRDMAEHGHNTTWFYPAGNFGQLPPGGNHAFGKLIPLAQQAGLLDPDVPAVLLGSTPVDAATEEQRKAAVTWVQDQCRKRGLPEMIAFIRDEPQYPRDDIAVKTLLKHSHNLSMRVNIDLAGSGAYGFGSDRCDIFTVMDGGISPEMAAESARTGTEIWTYSYRMWREHFDPLSQRYFAGFYTWTHKLKGNWMWAYHHGHHRHSWFAPGSHEPMPLTAHEARREGIDDYRYLQMLEDRIAANPDTQSARQATKWLMDLRVRLMPTVPNLVEKGEPLALAEFDEIRERAAGYIEKLGPAPARAAIRPPAAHARDEAAPFRGKPVAVCITGLGSGAASQRRSAATALYELGPKAVAAVEPLARVLDDAEVRLPALRALEAIGPDAFRAVPQIAKLLEHPDFHVRTAAVLTLAEIGCPMDKRQRGGIRKPSPHAAIVAKSLVISLRHDDAEELLALASEVLAAMGSFAKLALPEAIRMLDDPSKFRRNAGVTIITGMGADAARAVPKLAELHENKPGEIRYIKALAAIGPAASPAIPALERYAAKENLGPKQADSYYALFCIRGEVADLRKMVDLLKHPRLSAGTKKHVAKLFERLGAKAGPVADEVRQIVELGALAKETAVKKESGFGATPPAQAHYVDGADCRKLVGKLKLVAKLPLAGWLFKDDPGGTVDFDCP